MKTVVKAIVIVCAAVTCVTRFVAFKYESSFSPETLRALFRAGVAGAALCAVGAVIWVIMERNGKKGT